MKFNSVCTNIPQYDPDNGGFTDEEKALGRKNIGAGGLPTFEVDTVPQWSGDLVLGKRTGSSMREIGVILRDPIEGQTKPGYLVPPRTFKGMNLVCDDSGNITWETKPSQLRSGDYTWIDDHYHINVSGLQEELHFSYTPESTISAINGSALNSNQIEYSAGQYINIAGLVINVTGLQPSGDYATRTDLEAATSGKLDTSAYTEPVQSDWNQNDDNELDYIKNKPTIPSLSGYATEQYVDDHTSGKLDASAYHEYYAGLHLYLQDYTFNVTGLQEELNFDYDDLGKISAINGSALYGNGGGEPIEYSAGEHISIDSDTISVTGLENLSAGPNVDIYEVDGHLEISAAGTGGGANYNAGQYIYIDEDFNTINATGLQPAGDYAYASALSAYATNQYVNNNFVKTSALSAYTTKTYVDNSVRSATSGKLNISDYTAPEQSDWIEDDVADLAYIKNKPTPIGLIAGPGIHLEDRTSAVVISCSASGGAGGGTSGFYTDLAGNAYFDDDFTYTYDGHFIMGSMEKAMVPVSNVSSDEGKVPVVYVRDGRCYYLLERIIPSYTSATNGKILGVQNNTLAWINNPVKIVADSADIPASGSSDNILYVVAAD